MEDTAKYLIHADFLADGVVERSDVVGAVFGQTEGLLGDDLDIRELQQSSKLGRIDVEVRHESGQSVGEITIASSLDRVETATLAAALEAIERICGIVGARGRGLTLSQLGDARALAEALDDPEPDPERVQTLAARLDVEDALREGLADG